MYGDVSEFVVLETLRGLDIAFDELAVMGSGAPVDLLVGHFIRLFGFSNTYQERSHSPFAF